MIDPFYAFLVFVLLLVFDLTAAQTWFAPYFRLGIPVFRKRVTASRSQDVPALIGQMEAALKSGPLNPSVRFRPIAANAIAVREALFENRSGMRYLPVFHLTLFHRADQSEVSVVGLINWYVIGTLFYLIYRLQSDPTYAVVAVLVVIIFVVSYLGQASVANRIAQLASQADS